MKKLLSRGPTLLAIVGVAAVAFHLGRSSVSPISKFAFVEKGQVVFESLMDRPQLSDEEIQRQVRAPILNLLRRYSDMGYVVIDVTRDREGYMSIASAPASGIDITDEMRAAIKNAAAAEHRGAAHPGSQK